MPSPHLGITSNSQLFVSPPAISTQSPYFLRVTDLPVIHAGQMKHPRTADGEMPSKPADLVNLVGMAESFVIDEQCATQETRPW